MNEKIQQNVEKAKKMAEKEIAKVRKELGSAGKKIEDYVKKNPEKATLISAGIGAAIGAALAVMLRGKKKK